MHSCRPWPQTKNEGVVMFRSRPLQFSLAAAVMLAAVPAAHGASAGHVEFATVGVSAIGPGGQPRPVARGAEIQPGDTIDTGDGRAQLRFSDGGLVSLQPQTRFSLENYAYEKDDSGKNSIVMKLFKGSLRSITGLIGKTNRQGYKLQTATATVGIRGTEFSINQSADGAILFHCADGTIEVTNQAGSAVISGGQSARVTSANSAPQQTDEKPFLPPGTGNVGIALPNNPVQDSTPATPPLVGTFTGQWRVGTDAASFGPTTFPPPVFIVGPDGTLQSFSDGSTATTLGAAHAVSDGNDGVMAWGRWIGGPAPGVGYNDFNNVFAANNPLHYVVGLPVTNLPTSGTGTYTSYGNSVMACSGGPCGSISVIATLSINFGSGNGSYSATTRNSADGLTIQASGALAYTSGVANFSSGNSTVTGGFGGPTTGTAGIDGFLAGPGASHAGAIYTVQYAPGPSQQTVISGALVFRR